MILSSQLKTFSLTRANTIHKLILRVSAAVQLHSIRGSAVLSHVERRSAEQSTLMVRLPCVSCSDCLPLPINLTEKGEGGRE